VYNITLVFAHQPPDNTTLYHLGVQVAVTKTDLQGLVVTSSDGYVRRTIANSWFSVEQTYLQKKKWLKISLPSSTYSVADLTG
jgi:hypothetical protein